MPIGIALMVSAPRYLPETKRQRGQLDIAGAATSTLGMTALVYGIVRSAEKGWADPTTVVAVAAGLLLLAAFVMVERRAAQPIMPLRLFASRERSSAYAARFLFLGAMVPFWFFTTQYLQTVAGYTPVQAGLAFLPITLVNFAVAMSVPRLTARFGNATLLAVSLAVSVVGMAWLGRLSASTPYLTGIALPMMLIGAGQGGALAPLTSAGIVGVAPEDAGAAGGVTKRRAPGRRLTRPRGPRCSVRRRRLHHAVWHSAPGTQNLRRPDRRCCAARRGPDHPASQDDRDRGCRAKRAARRHCCCRRALSRS
ncbi:MAG: hypothetical protein WAU42_05475 [Solirubrobacteraceae bacterium]